MTYFVLTKDYDEPDSVYHISECKIVKECKEFYTVETDSARFAIGKFWVYSSRDEALKDKQYYEGIGK